MHINSYLTFNGNCREAMSFYQECLGGKLILQTVGDSPLQKKMPEQMKESILHASLVHKELIILASDMVSDSGLIKGNSVSLSLECDTDQELEMRYSKLAAGGKTNHPIERTFWGAMFGGLTDKYGIHWLLISNEKMKV